MPGVAATTSVSDEGKIGALDLQLTIDINTSQIMIA